MTNRKKTRELTRAGTENEVNSMELFMRNGGVTFDALALHEQEEGRKKRWAREHTINLRRRIES